MERVVEAGVPAYNEGPRLSRAVRSLLDQDLPPGHRWGRLWIVVSGSTDGTLAVAQRLAAEDPRVRVLHQERREGKASALSHLFAHAQGDRLVLLNGDALARPGSVAAMLTASEGVSGPFAVMGRPVLAPGAGGPLSVGLEALWEIHHRIHLATVASGRSNHLSDELWLLPLPVPALLPTGVVNDGSYLGARLLSRGGSLHYVPRAEVEIRVPSKVSDHLRQRRRIHWGHQQVEQTLGEVPTTWWTFLRSDPAEALRVVRASLPPRPAAYGWFSFFALLEAVAWTRAAVDRKVGHVDHARWRPTRDTLPSARAGLLRRSLRPEQEHA